MKVKFLTATLLTLIALGSVYSQNNDQEEYTFAFYPVNGVDTLYMLPQQQLSYNIHVNQVNWVQNIVALEYHSYAYWQGELLSMPVYNWNIEENGYPAIPGASYYTENDPFWRYQIVLTQNWLAWHTIGTVNYQNLQPVGHELRIENQLTVLNSDLATTYIHNTKHIISQDGILGDISGDGMVDMTDVELLTPYSQIQPSSEWFTNEGLNYGRGSILFVSNIGLVDLFLVNLYVVDPNHPMFSNYELGIGELMSEVQPPFVVPSVSSLSGNELTIETDAYAVCVKTILPDGTMWSEQQFVANEHATIIIPNPSLEYEVTAVQLNSALATDEEGQLSPSEFRLNQNYPNPFNPSTTISYFLPSNGPVELTIFSMTGETIKTIVSDEQPAGNHSILIDLGQKNLSSGIYLYRLVTPDYQATRKLSYIK
ncbi:MAG: T9SS type A sorting domain-containing protein [Candidatus Komeilibacteria bacterium]